MQYVALVEHLLATHEVKTEIPAITPIFETNIAKNDFGSRIVETDDTITFLGVAILSELSENTTNGKRRHYLPETLRECMHKFEGMRVNIDHPETKKNMNENGETVQSRPLGTTVGKVENVKMREVLRGAEKQLQISGDLVLIKNDRTMDIARLAKMDHKLVGLSIRGDAGIMESEQEAQIVQLEPNGLDLVDRPATNEGLFECIVMEGKKKMKKKKAKEGVDPLTGIPTITKKKDETSEAEDEDKNGEKTSEAEDENDDVKEVEDEEETSESEDENDEETSESEDENGEETEEVEDENGEEVEDENGEETEEVEDENGEETSEAEDETEDPTMLMKTYRDKANKCTTEANQSRTHEAHITAAFSHYGAAGNIAELGGDYTKEAYKHVEAAKQHTLAAEKLKTKKESANDDESDEKNVSATEAVADFKKLNLTPKRSLIKAYTLLESVEDRSSFLIALVKEKQPFEKKVDVKEKKKEKKEEQTETESVSETVSSCFSVKEKKEDEKKEGIKQEVASLF